MAKAAKIVLPKRWQRFPSAYAKNLDYWYFSKGLAATAVAIRPRLEALKPLRRSVAHAGGPRQFVLATAVHKRGTVRPPPQWPPFW